MNDCRTIEFLLPEAATSSLSPAVAHAVEEHLRGCVSCARTAAEMREFFSRHVAPEAVPESYWMTILPRVRQGIDARKTFELPAFVLKRLSPALAALFLLVVGSELIPTKTGSSPGDAAMLLTSLPESELVSVAERHDSEAPIMLPADIAENASPDLEESSMIQEIVDAETTVNLYAYLDPDVALGNLADEDQVKLISMIEHE